MVWWYVAYTINTNIRERFPRPIQSIRISTRFSRFGAGGDTDSQLGGHKVTFRAESDKVPIWFPSADIHIRIPPDIVAAERLFV